jgi:hypothetical protein
MNIQKLDLKELMKASICSFAIAKRLKAEGITRQFTYAYDDQGDLCDGGWLEGIIQKPFYPAIDLASAIGLVEEVPGIENCQLQFHQVPNRPDFYSISLNNWNAIDTNLPDLLMWTWLKFKKK